MARLIDLKHQRFSRLFVECFSHLGKHKERIWKCVCDCGNPKEVSTSHLRSGFVKSCGCLKTEVVTEKNKNNSTHNLTNSSEYGAYRSALKRCNNPGTASYKGYGGRGIKFLLPSFEEFYAFIGPKPSKDHSLDRINNEGHYTLDNIRWATKSEQARNRRKRIYSPRRKRNNGKKTG